MHPRAGDGSRTRDNQLGRLELYQLSYSRICVVSPSFVQNGWWWENIVCRFSSCRCSCVCRSGGGRIRTFEVRDDRFTVCSLWPLGNPSLEPSREPPRRISVGRFSALAVTLALLGSGAGEGTRTRNLLITNQLL